MTCKDCQLACYDLLDRSLCAKDEREVLAHIESCPQCRAFLEEEGCRMRTWPRLLGIAARNATVPPDAVERVAHALEVSHAKGVRRSPNNGWIEFFRRYRNWTALAASLFILAGIGTAVWYAENSIRRDEVLGVRSGETWASSVPAVRLMSQTDVRGLDLPGALPGRLRLESGEAVVRLGSGVELTVLGPASLEVRDTMQIALERGRLLANVPHWATGFLVRTADLEVYDLGTVFSVSVDWPVSDVFVFKGRVRVNEAGHGETENATAGDVVGICGAGEGVRAEAGERPVKFAADWPAAKKAFASVRDQAATEKPALALAFAEKIADLWMDGCLSRELSRVSVKRSAAVSSSKIPFSKTAWVRPAAPSQQETSRMNAANSLAALAVTAVMMGAETSGATSAPIQVDTSPGYSRHWRTVFTNEVPLRWNWNAAATHAELDIKGMNASFTTNFTEVASNCLWRVFTSPAPSAEDVYDLTLTFYSGTDAVVGVQTSRLAVVTAAFGRTAVIPSPTARVWTTVRDNVVIPYDAGWAAATVAATNSQLVIAKMGGSTQTHGMPDAAGYYGWKLKNSGWGYGTFNLALTFCGMAGEWDATVARPMDGTLVKMQ